MGGLSTHWAIKSLNSNDLAFCAIVQYRPPVVSHIDAPAMQQSRELALDTDEVEARNMAGLELHQYVDVTVGAEIVSKDGAKQSQPRDVMSSAERRYRVTID